MAFSHPDFVAVGGAGSPAAHAALAAAKLGRSAGLLANSAYQTEPAGVQVVTADTARIGSEHVPYTWLDTEVLLVAPEGDEVDSATLGRFSRSLIGLIARAFLQNGSLSLAGGVVPPGVGALFLAEDDLPSPSVNVPAPIALSVGQVAGVRLWWQGGWQVVGDARHADSPMLSAVAAIFLVRLTETRDALSAARFAAAAATLLPPSSEFSVESLPTREAIIAAETSA